MSKLLQSAAYTALIVNNMHRLGIGLCFLCYSALCSHVSGGFSLYALTYGPAHILRHVQCTAWLRLYPFGVALAFIFFLLTCRHVGLILGAQSDEYSVQELWYASVVRILALWLWREAVAVLVWLMGQEL